MTQQEIDKFIQIYEDKLPHIQVKMLTDFLDKNNIQFNYEGALIKDKISGRMCPIFCYLDASPEALVPVIPESDKPRIGNFAFKVKSTKTYDGGLLAKPLYHTFEVYFKSDEHKWRVGNWVSQHEDMKDAKLMINDTDMDGVIGYINRFI